MSIPEGKLSRRFYFLTCVKIIPPIAIAFYTLPKIIEAVFFTPPFDKKKPEKNQSFCRNAFSPLDKQGLSDGGNFHGKSIAQGKIGGTGESHGCYFSLPRCIDSFNAINPHLCRRLVRNGVVAFSGDH